MGKKKRREEIIDGPIVSTLSSFLFCCPQELVGWDPGERRFCLLKTFSLETNEALEACLWLSAAPQDKRPKRKLGQKLYLETLDNCLEYALCQKSIGDVE